MLGRLKQLADARASFAFETTLSSRSFAPWIRDLIGRGYDFYLLFLWLPSPETAIRRVAGRVQMGGHDVPAETIRRRYHSGLRNFFTLYRPLARRWRLYDNSTGSEPRLIAGGSKAAVKTLADASLWRTLCKAYEDQHTHRTGETSGGDGSGHD